MPVPPDNWLNDEVINYACRVFVQPRQAEHRRKVHVYNSYFMTMLMRCVGRTDSCNFSDVHGFDGRIHGGLSSLDELYIPVNLNDNHWIFIRVIFSSKVIELWDSTGIKVVHESSLRATHKYLHYALHKGLEGGAPPYETWLVDWTAVNRSNDSPRQINGADCGIFMLTSMALLRSGDRLEPRSYTQEMLSFR